MTSADLPEPVPFPAPARDEPRGRRSQAAWAVLAVGLLAVGALVVVNRPDREDPDIEIALPLPTNQVLLGGQGSALGSDPDRGIEANVWLNVAGPRASTSNGDLFHAQTDEIALPTGTGSYDPEGHRFAVSVTDAPAGQDLVIEAFDPAWIYVGDHCEREVGQRSTGRVEASPRCTGDQSLGSSGRSQASTTTTTTYVVRSPDATPDDHADNPVLCASTYAGWSKGPTGGPDANAPAGVITDSTYQSWTGLCRVSAAEVQLGAYEVQVRTNADLGAPRWATDGSLAGDAGTLVNADPDARGTGHNRFALRAGWGGNPDGTTGVAIQAIDHLSIYANGTDATAQFSLVRVPTGAAGRSLRLGFWDLGDVRGGSGLQLTVGSPAGARSASDPSVAVAVGCEVLGPSATRVQVNGCVIAGIRTDTFNAAMLEVRVLIPSDYRCDAADDCWLPLRLDYPGAHPADSTTWLAEWDQDGSIPREQVSPVPATALPQDPDPIGTLPGTLPGTLRPPSTSSTTTTSVLGPPGTREVPGTTPRRPGTVPGREGDREP